MTNEIVLSEGWTMHLSDELEVDLDEETHYSKDNVDHDVDHVGEPQPGGACQRSGEPEPADDIVASDENEIFDVDIVDNQYVRECHPWAL